MAALARAYLATKPDPALYAFLRLNFVQLQPGTAAWSAWSCRGRS